MKTESINRFEALVSEATPRVANEPGHVDRELVRHYMHKAAIERAGAFRAAAGAVVGAIGGVFRALRRKVDEVRNIDALNAMDDRMLKDLGIDRSQIAGLVRNSASGVAPYRNSPDLVRAANAAGISDVA